MGVGEWFQTFCGNLKIGTGKRESIAYRTGRIVGQLNHDLRSLNSSVSYRFYVGSYGRSSAIPSVSDVDLLYELPPHLYERYNAYQANGQSALLSLVRSSLAKTYPTTQIGGDGQVVVIEFNDGVKFEVLPAFSNVSGGYTYADSNNGGAWRTCKPKQELAAFSTRNQECNRNLVELARMTRAWRDRNAVSMSGMLIDTLAYQFMATWAHKDKSFLYYDFMARDFFSFLGALSVTQTYWTAPGSGSYVYGSGFQYKAIQANALVLEAIENAKNGYEYTARQKYREVYGTAYPQ